MEFFQKKSSKLTLIASMFAMLAIPAASWEYVFADSSSDFTVATGRGLNSPQALDILAKIELFKQQQTENEQRKKQLAEQRKHQEERQKFIDEQRRIAQLRLDTEVNRMNQEYADFAPKPAFAKFVSKVPDNVQGVFWGMFDYQQAKVKAAQSAMKEVLDNGGSYSEARKAYNEKASTKRVQLIELTRDLNIEHGLADETVQLTFDKYGKLPRYD